MTARRAVVLSVLACGVGPNGLDLGRPVAEVQVIPSIASFREGDTVRFTTVTLDRDGRRTTPRTPLVWSTPDVIHVRVDSTGLVHGLLPGPAEVRVTADSVTGIARVTVLPLPVGSIEVIMPAEVIEVGDAVRLLAIVRDVQGKRLFRTPVWTSSDPTRIQVDSTGLLRAVEIGSARLTATVENVSGGVDVTALVPVAAVRVTPDSLALQYDDTARLTVILLDSGGGILPTRPVTWSISGDSAIELTSDLKLTATGAGRLVLTATAGHASGHTAIAVASLALTAITAGATHSCGVRTDGAAFCWGEGHTGALGMGDTLSSMRPRRTVGGLTFSQLSAGTFQTCGVTTAGDTYCWGLDHAGQTVQTPRLLGGGVHFARVAVGDRSSCGVTPAGVAYCWGAGGILGDSTTQPSATPVAVVGSHVFLDLADPGDDGTCGRVADGTIFCWGLFPRPLASGTGFDTMSGGLGLYCGLRAGVLSCWGWIPTSDASASGAGSPVSLLPSLRFTSVSANAYHVCALSVTGEAVCWGANQFGQLGNGTLTGRFGDDGAPVAGGHVFTQIVTGGKFATGGWHSCGVTGDGHAYCWGANGHWQLGAPIGQRAVRPVLTTGQN
jgi:uncharacterized protein YjdB